MAAQGGRKERALLQPEDLILANFNLLARAGLPTKPVKYHRGGGDQAFPERRSSLDRKGGLSNPATERLRAQIFINYNSMPDTSPV
jgi:hypothetical protein